MRCRTVKLRQGSAVWSCSFLRKGRDWWFWKNSPMVVFCHSRADGNPVFLRVLDSRLRGSDEGGKGGSHEGEKGLSVVVLDFLRDYQDLYSFCLHGLIYRIPDRLYFAICREEFLLEVSGFLPNLQGRKIGDSNKMMCVAHLQIHRTGRRTSTCVSSGTEWFFAKRCEKKFSPLYLECLFSMAMRSRNRGSGERALSGFGFLTW